MMKFDQCLFCEDKDIRNPKILEIAPLRQRRTPIMVTLSDAEMTTVDIKKMLEAGMNFVRFRMSHTTKGDKIRLIGKIDKAALGCSTKWNVGYWPVGTCMELKTCIMKTGMLEDLDTRSIYIKEGTEVVLTCDISYFNKCNEHLVFVDNPNLAEDMKVDTEISFNCESIVLQCIKTIDHKSIMCLVIVGGDLMDMSTVCARGVVPSVPAITKRDQQIIRFAMEYQIDMITINYVRGAESIQKAKAYMGKACRRPLIFSGICTMAGLNNIDEIIKESDGIILSREYLAYHLPSCDKYKMTQIQKWVGAKCQQGGKPLYLSGGVLQDTILKGTVPGNEISDITNALLDNCISGFILRDYENADLLVEAIKVLNSICCNIEPHCDVKSNFWRITDDLKMPVNAAEAAALSACVSANQTNSRVIIIPTVTGKTCRALLRLRPTCLVITVSTNLSVIRMLQICRCVVPIMYTACVTAKQTNSRVIIIPTVTGKTCRALLRLRPTCLVITVSTNLSVIRMLQICRCVVPIMYTVKKKMNFIDAMEDRIQYAVEFAVQRAWLMYGDVYTTLQRGTEGSAYCDTVRVWKTTILKKPLVECLY